MSSLDRMIDACGDIAIYTAILVSKGIDVKLIYEMLNSMSLITDYSVNMAFQETEDDLPWDSDDTDNDNNADILTPEQFEEINRRLSDTKNKVRPSEIIHTEKDLRAKSAAYLYMIAEYLYKKNDKKGKCLDCEVVECSLNESVQTDYKLFCENIKPTVDELTELMAQAHLQRIKTGTLAPDEVWERMITKGETPEEGDVS